MIKVSVIIPTYQRKEGVLRILNALSSQTFPSKEFEVIISIDGSTDGTKEAVDDFDAEFITHCYWEQNSGKSSACNRAIKDARGELLILIDDDMVPSPQLLESHYEAHKGHTKLGVIGAAPITLAEDAPLFITFIRDKFSSHMKKISQPGYNLRIWDFYGGNFSIKKELMLRIGMFDESFKVYGYEDVELGNRLLNAEVKIIFSQNALCFQHYEDNLRSLAHKTINSGKSAVLLASRYPDTFSELQLVEYNLTGWKWHTLRLVLIWASMIFPFIPDVTVFIINRFEKSNPLLYKRLYQLAMDYFFWLGVWAALRRDNNKQLLSKIKSFKKTTQCPTP